MLTFEQNVGKKQCGLGPKIIQIHCKPGGLEDRDPKSEISKIKFGPKIQAPKKFWKYKQVKLNGPLLAKSMWVWPLNHGNSL